MLTDDDPRSRTDEIARITTPWVLEFDAGISRVFRFGKFHLTAFVYAQNLLNRKNEIHVYRRTGTTSDDGTLERYGQYWYGDDEFFDLYQLINHGHREHYRRKQGGDLFGRPREIRFGIQVGFGNVNRGGGAQ